MIKEINNGKNKRMTKMEEMTKIGEMTKDVIEKMGKMFLGWGLLFWTRVQVTKEKMAYSKGLTTIEIILIIVVLVALILIFKDELGALINRIFDNIRSESGDVMSGY